MAYFRRKFYYNENNMPDGLKPIYAGFDLLQSHPLFSQLDGTIAVRNAHLSNHSSLACVTKNGEISVNIHARLNGPMSWPITFSTSLLAILTKTKCLLPQKSILLYGIKPAISM